MLQKILKAAAVGVGALLVVGSGLYLFLGLRVVLDGGARPHLRFVESAEQQAERIRRHRAAQREQTPPVDTLLGDAGPATEAGATSSSAPGGGEPEPTAPGAGGLQRGTPVGGGLQASAAASSAPPAPTRPPPYWTDFRGPRRDGEYREVSLMTIWPTRGLTPVWKQPAGAGYASFVIARGRAFTIEQRGASEVVAAYDVVTGRELWTHSWSAEFRESMGGDGPRATPTWASGHVLALGAKGELRSLDDSSGRVLWRTNILEDSGAANLPWGMAAAPLVVDDTVIVLPGGPNGQSVVAYDRRTGTRAWSALGDQQGYSSPMLVTIRGVRQILVFSATRLMGLAIGRGDVLWEYAWIGPNGINAAQPLMLGDSRIFVSSGYGAGAAVIEITGGAGDFSVREVWRNTRMKNRFASSVLYQGVIYGLDESILAAVDAGTGELKWKAGRYGYGQLLLADGHLIVLTEEGELALVRARPDRLEELARFPALQGKTWNPPAIAGGYLLVRNLAEMAAFDLRLAR